MSNRKKATTLSTKDFDKKFDEGLEDITQHLDLKSGRHPNLEPRRVNVDLPEWVIQSLDAESQRLGVTRQSIIKVWIAEKLDGLAAERILQSEKRKALKE